MRPPPNRQSIRMRGYDYTRSGAYFVTIVAAGRVPRFGHLLESGVRYSTLGDIASDCWLALPRHFPYVTLDVWQLMPDHLHGILVLTRPEHDTAADQPIRRPIITAGTLRGSLSAVIQSYKSQSTRSIRRDAAASGEAVEDVWQRNYYEHIIRDEPELIRIRQYIIDNPARAWFASQRRPSNNP